MERVMSLVPYVVLIGAIGLLQAHGIAFWSSKLGAYGIGWSVLLEATALWLLTRPAIGSRLLGLATSLLLLLGPLYQVGTPILDGLALAAYTDEARVKEIPPVEAEIRELEGQLTTFTANSRTRPGWLPAIEATRARLSEARGKLAAFYREVPKHTARAEAQDTLVGVMVCIGLVLFQVAAVLAVTHLAQERRQRLAVQSWRPFGFVGRWAGTSAGSASVPIPAATESQAAASADPPSSSSLDGPARTPAPNVLVLAKTQGEKSGTRKRAKPKPRGTRQALGRVPQFSSVERHDG